MCAALNLIRFTFTIDLLSSIPITTTVYLNMCVNRKNAVTTISEDLVYTQHVQSNISICIDFCPSDKVLLRTNPSCASFPFDFFHHVPRQASVAYLLNVAQCSQLCGVFLEVSKMKAAT